MLCCLWFLVEVQMTNLPETSVSLKNKITFFNPEKSVGEWLFYIISEI